jgi:hypothetical protein
MWSPDRVSPLNLRRKEDSQQPQNSKSGPLTALLHKRIKGNDRADSETNGGREVRPIDS